MCRGGVNKDREKGEKEQKDGPWKNNKEREIWTEGGQREKGLGREAGEKRGGRGERRREG